MRLARARRAEQDHVLLGVQEVQLAEVLDHLLFDRALEGEVELLERLARWEASGFDARLAAVGIAGLSLGGEQGLGEALIAPLLGPRALGELGHGPRCRRRLHRPEQVRKLRGRAHAISWS